MKLTVLGCAGSASAPQSASSSYLLSADDGSRTWTVVLDLGSGAFGKLLGQMDPAKIDAVLLSHLHADHMVDMAALQVYLRYGPTSPHPAMPVYGPDGTGERIRQVIGQPDPISADFDVLTWSVQQPVQIGPFDITVTSVVHPVPAFAMRITGPREDGTGRAVLTYSGDTDACAGLLEAAADADFFLCEAAFGEDCDVVRGVHLTGRRAGQAAAKAHAKQLVLTHVQPWADATRVLDEATAEYSGPIELATPGATWLV